MFFSDVGHKGSAVSVPFGAFGTFMIRSAVACVDMVIEGSSFFIPLSACAATPEIDIFFRQKNFGHLMHVRMSGRSTISSWLHLDLARAHNRTRVYVDLTLRGSLGSSGGPSGCSSEKNDVAVGGGVGVRHANLIR